MVIWDTMEVPRPPFAPVRIIVPWGLVGIVSVVDAWVVVLLHEWRFLPIAGGGLTTSWELGRSQRICMMQRHFEMHQDANSRID